MISICLRPLMPTIANELLKTPKVWGARDRLTLDPTSNMVGTLFNVSSGKISVGAYSFAGHGVMLITGTHDPGSFGSHRRDNYPKEGRDISVGRGVWIGSGAVVLGPATIGDDAVVSAGAVVVGDVPAGTVVGGVPARVLRTLSPARSTS